MVVWGLVLYGHAHARSTKQQRDGGTAIEQVLARHHTDVLVGNRWRVLPVDVATSGAQVVVPFESCTRPSGDQQLSSRQTSLQGKRFAYLLTLEGNYGSAKRCTIEQIATAYGRPDATIVMAGTSERPKELLFFYDHGIRPASAARPQQRLLQDVTTQASGANLRPIQARELSHTACEGHRTVMQVVAHEDDDLLFMNPDLYHSAQRGDCIRTLYITAGDAGSSKFYWLGREQGSEAAYSTLTGASDIWIEQVVRLADHQFVTAVSPSDTGRFSLLFMHLPDGNPDGRGFPNSGYESIANLETGANQVVRSVDGQSSYSYGQLVRAITQLLNTYKPDEVRTQFPSNDSPTYTDHSDHMAVGRFTTSAFQAYHAKHPKSVLAYYKGYPVRDFEPNVFDDDLAAKEQAFFVYSRFDGAVCGSHEQCLNRGDYGAYLERQYRFEK